MSSKICLEKINLKNSLLQIYTNKTTPCPSTKGFLYGEAKSSIKLYELSKLILESKIGILHKNTGLNRLLVIIIQDLRNLVNILGDYLQSSSNNFDLKKYMYIVVIGKNNITKLKAFLNSIIVVLNTIKDKPVINLKSDLEDPIINAITIHLLGQNTIKHYEKSKKLLNEILKHIFFIYVSPWGLQIHERFINFAEDTDLKEALLLIIRFLLSDTILGYSGILVSKLIFPIDNLRKRMSSFKSSIKEKAKSIKSYFLGKKEESTEEKAEINTINTIIEKYITDINSKIKEYKKCSKNGNCIINNKSEGCAIINNISDSNIIIGQAKEGSLIANLLIKAEFNQRDDTYLSMNLLLSDVIYDSIPSWLPKDTKNKIKKSILDYLDNIIKDYNSLNCAFFKIMSIVKALGYEKIIYGALANWGLIPLNYGETYNFFNKSNKINNSDLILEKTFRGIININNKKYDILYVNIVKKEGSEIKYYYSPEAISYKCEESIDKDLLYLIYARINNIRLIYSQYYYIDNNRSNNYINLLPNINYKDNEYKIQLITNLKDLPNDYLICFEKNKECGANIINNVYKVNDDNEIKKDFFERLMKSLKDEGFTVQLTSININKSTNQPQNIIKFNIKRIKFVEGEEKRIKYIIPRSYLFLNQTLEYIVISVSEDNDRLTDKKININGGKKNKNSKSKKIKKLK
jgi:hypothetical protein